MANQLKDKCTEFKGEIKKNREALKRSKKEFKGVVEEGGDGEFSKSEEVSEEQERKEQSQEQVEEQEDGGCSEQQDDEAMDEDDEQDQA